MLRKVRLSLRLLLCLLILLPVGSALANGPAPALAPLDSSAATDSAVAWLQTIVQPGGGINSGYGGDVTSRAMIAVAAAGRDARTMRSAATGLSLVSYAQGHASQHTNVGQVGRWAAALAMTGENPFWAGGADLSKEILGYYDAGSGCFDVFGNVWNQCYAIWGLTSTMTAVPAGAIEWLEAQQNADGGWGWAAGQPSDSNSTALALQTLAALGRDTVDVEIAAGLTYLQTVQNDDGGFLNDPRYGLDSDTDSTSAVLQTLTALGPAASSHWDWTRTITVGETVTSSTPLDYLNARQLPSGAFEWQPGFGPNVMTTLSAVPALAEQPIPFVSDPIEAAQQAVAWLRAQQQADGSFSAGMGDPASATLDVLIAGLAAGQPAHQWSRTAGGPTTLSFLAATADAYASDAARLGKLISAVVLAGGDPQHFGGIDLVARLRAQHDGSGRLGSTTLHQAWGMIGLASVGLPISGEMVSLLAEGQQADGGWEGGPGWGTDSNTTSTVLQALASGRRPVDQTLAAAATGYLQAQRGDTGGFVYSAAYGLTPDANSTALGIQALLALDLDVSSPTWAHEGVEPLGALLALQLTQGANQGAFEWQSGEGANLLATAQAVPALLRSTFPLHRVHTAATFMPIAWDATVSTAE